MTSARRWQPATGGWTAAAAPEGDPLVSDSWLVVGGRVRGLERHWERFAAGVGDVGAAVDLLRFRAAVESALPASGRWFPRVELRPGDELRLLLRPAPPAGDRASAWLAGAPDPRRRPRRKGPELTVLGSLRQQAARHGADEAVLTDAGGGLLEGAYSSLLWWEDDTLCVVADTAPVLCGVTRALLLGLASAAGVGVRRSPPPPLAALAGREVWLTSALHGIRAVTAWRPAGPPCGAAVRAPDWQRRLDALGRPVGAPAAPWAE